MNKEELNVEEVAVSVEDQMTEALADVQDGDLVPTCPTEPNG